MEEIRLQKYIAMCGKASRRKAEELIEAGKVSVNGMIITEPGTKVKEGDTVTVGGKKIQLSVKKEYILLNKPEMVITSVKDQFGRKTVMDFVESGERIYPVGRLDYGTSGLIILTNDGDFANFLMHPGNEIKKTYRATLKGELKDEDRKRIEKGVYIDGVKTFPAVVNTISYDGQFTTAEIIIHEGRNHQVKKMFQVAGYKVSKLERIAIGSIKISSLHKGRWRRLEKKEISELGFVPKKQ